SNTTTPTATPVLPTVTPTSDQNSYPTPKLPLIIKVPLNLDNYTTPFIAFKQAPRIFSLKNLFDQFFNYSSLFFRWNKGR
ncbi:MAG: hypothetical protein M1514_01060, partial [Patescibacteria group bacterium]|nr:hypothetical protein [Patescibacteria group bacterium]